MELSDRTLQVLKNYASINPNIVFETGNVLKTLSAAKNVMSSSVITEEFPRGFGIYDLNEFLGVVGLVDRPQLQFKDSHVLVSDSIGLARIKYFYSDPDMLTAPSKEIVMPECEVKFTLDTDTLGRIRRAASTLGHNELSITPDNGSIRLAVVDSADKTSNAFSIDVEGEYEEGTQFSLVLNVNNLKVINEDFDVGISSKLISNFKSKQSEIQYFIALEKTSTFGA